MKKVILGLLMLIMADSVFAGCSTPTTIKSLIVRANDIEIWTDTAGGACSTENGWHLMNTHPNFNALYSGLLASKASGKKVDIVGTGVCDGPYEIRAGSYFVN